MERRRADGAALVVFAGRLVRRRAQLQLGGVRFDLDARRPAAARPERSGHRRQRTSRRYQDPTAAASTVPGAMAVATELLRPYRGLGAIVPRWPRFHTKYDSIQTCLQPPLPERLAGGRELDARAAVRRQHAFASAPRSTTRMARLGSRAIRKPSTSCCRTSGSGGTSSRATSCGISPTSKRSTGAMKVIGAARERLAAVGHLHRAARARRTMRRTPTRRPART